jgi:hypothetical protein
LALLEQRRREEKEMVLSKDTEEREEGDKSMWFIVSGDWLFQWKSFISNKISSNPAVS